MAESLCLYLTLPQPALSESSLNTTRLSAVSTRWLQRERERESVCVCVSLWSEALPGVEILVVPDLSGRESVENIWSSGEEADVDHLLACLLL